ncbi:hypothetical protein J3Q64DRAFT_1707046 [Phycomyces blakesleeanus]|uniref:Ribosomal protein/NADH dehydrogenase domain-containing protein n=1 Tax=Phycomyces blakesleeanus TaxID=4837 RepID=A0ABR3BC54_PHYBL
MSLRSLKSTRDIIANLTTGVGAQKLAFNVSKVSLTIPIKGKHEGMGAKHFLHESLPRLQYNNPSVVFEVAKNVDPKTKPELTIHFNEQSPKILAIPSLHSDVICDMLLRATP